MKSTWLIGLPILLLNIPLWLVYGAISVVLGLVGIPIVTLAALGRQWEFMPSKVWPDRIIRRWWHLGRWMNAIYGNEQDGIDGLPANHPPSYSAWPDRKFKDIAARIIAWSAFRNATNNLRFLRCFAPRLGWVNPGGIVPSKVRWVGSVDRSYGVLLCWQRLYAGLKLKAFGTTLWIGWKLNPGMAEPDWWPLDPCWRGIGFTAGQIRNGK
jgi:hypothetical protein